MKQLRSNNIKIFIFSQGTIDVAMRVEVSKNKLEFNAIMLYNNKEGCLQTIEEKRGFLSVCVCVCVCVISLFWCPNSSSAYSMSDKNCLFLRCAT
jgi:hypothetical protein